jgi:hypothetical protein
MSEQSMWPDGLLVEHGFSYIAGLGGIAVWTAMQQADPDRVRSGRTS